MYETILGSGKDTIRPSVPYLGGAGVPRGLGLPPRLEGLVGPQKAREALDAVEGDVEVVRISAPSFSARSASFAVPFGSMASMLHMEDMQRVQHVQYPECSCL